MNQRGQNIIELTVLIAASMLALLLIITIYSTQFGVITSFDDYYTARATVRKIVDAANTVYYAGPGSEMKILVEIPRSAIIEESIILGKTVSMHMADGSDIIDVADVNINGEWQEDSKYYMILRYDGNVIWQIEKGYEVVGGTAFILKDNPITDTDLNFLITNTFDKDLHFELEMFYEMGSPGIDVSFENNKDTLEFDLASGEDKVIYFRIQGPASVCHVNSTGYFDVNATGEDYEYIDRQIVSVEYDWDC